MNGYSRTHLADPALLHLADTHVAADRATTAELLADLGEIDARRLYAPAGFPSMFAFCVGQLHLSEDATARRIHAARAARRCPALFPMVADGRLNLTAVQLLAPHLTPENAPDLLAAAAWRSRSEVERLLAERFPQPDLVARIDLPRVQSDQNHTEYQQFEHAPEHVESQELALTAASAPAESPAAAARPVLKPLSAAGYGLQCTLPAATYEKLARVQALLGHEVPSQDLPEVLDRAFEALLAQLEKRKFGATRHPRRAHAGENTHPRRIPNAVKRAVWARDGARCTFVSESGHRCEARGHLEFDHIESVARGGQSTESNLRLRCRAHNQYAADQAFGAGYMDRKRGIARGESEGRAADSPASVAIEPATGTTGTLAGAEPADVAAGSGAAARARALEAARRAAAAAEVIPYLRRLEIGPDLAREAALGCEADPELPLEERIKLALRCYGRLRHPGARPQVA